MNSIHKTALKLLGSGKPVFPVERATKKPLVAWGEFQNRLPTEEEITNGWTHYPDANIGMATGHLSGLLVIDCDSQEAAAAFIENYPEVNHSLQAKTGRGVHFYLQFEETIRNDAGRLLGPGTDVRGEGGFVIVPPSVHANGTAYQWLNKNKPLPLPQKLKEILINRNHNGAGNNRTVAALGQRERIIEGQRNARLTSLAGSMRRRGFTYEAIKDAILTENSQRCDPPLAANEVEQIAKSVARYPAQEEAENSFLPSKREVGKETNFNPLSAADLLSRQPEEISWIWKTLIAKGILFFLVAFMKIGKSTFSYKLAIAIAQGIPFLELETLKGGVLILAVEEHPRDVVRRLRRFGMRPEDPIYVHTGRLQNNEITIKALRDFILEKGIILVLVDSLSRYSNVRDENDNAGVIREVSPLLDLARETGAAIGLIHHERKSGGEDGRNIRGGSALFGLVDQAIILERRQGEVNNQRLIKTLGRYDESPRELVIELVGDEYKVLGTPEEMGEAQALAKAREALSVEPMDIKTIAKEADLKEKATRKALEQLREMGDAIREGEGKKNSPFTYRLPYLSDSFLSQHSLKGEETNPDRSGDGKSCQTFDL